jgi:hypothetical protein
MSSRASHNNRRGLALPSAMFTLLALSVMAAGMFTFADLGAKAVRNRESAARAVHVAEAGINHSLGLMRGSLRMHSFSRILRGSDNIPSTSDDSVLVGWGLAAGDEIPLVGKTFQGHTYLVTVRDDAADGDANASTDLNGRVKVRCRAVTADGARAEIEAIIGATPMPAMAADGDVGFSGSPTIAGACGGAHANGNLSSTGIGPTISTQATATGAASGNWRHPDGTPAPKLSGQPEVVIPDLNPMDFCTGAEFRLLSNGTATNGAGMVIMVPSGWTYNAGTLTWSVTGNNVDGTFCVQGNVSISGNTGSAAAPRVMSVLATGSIAVSGTPVITADHPDGILFMAAGDVTVAGNPTAGVNSYTGMIYAGAQCSASGNATMFGQLLCANAAQPAGATELVTGHSMSGNFVLTFDCSANVFNKRRVLYWYPRLGT